MNNKKRYNTYNEEKDVKWRKKTTEKCHTTASRCYTFTFTFIAPCVFTLSMRFILIFIIWMDGLFCSNLLLVGIFFRGAFLFVCVFGENVTFCYR